MISFISVTDVYEMHDLVVQQLGGHSGVYNEGLLESAVNQPLMILSYGNMEEQEITYCYRYCRIKKKQRRNSCLF
jgi:prophage maintenance system killer protein